MQLSEAEPTLNRTWDEVVSQAEGSTFFHTRAWSEIIASAFPSWRVSPLVLSLRTGNVAILPLLKQRWFLAGGYSESMVPGVYGGPVFQNAPSSEDWAEVWAGIDRLPSVVVFGNPYLSYLGGPKGTTRQAFTLTLDLTPGFGAVRKGYRKGHRADVKSALKNGVEVKVADQLGEVHAYYVAYQDALRRWGRRAGGFYTLKLFELFFTHREHGTNIRLWTARFEGKVIGGNWVFYHNDHAVVWHSAIHSDHMHRHAIHLAYDAAIESACASGLRWFDFNPSGGMPAIDHFKKGFGARRVDFLVYRRLGLPARAYRFFRYAKERYLRVSGL
jgi:hypothetical protein